MRMQSLHGILGTYVHHHCMDCLCPSLTSAVAEKAAVANSDGLLAGGILERTGRPQAYASGFHSLGWT